MDGLNNQDMIVDLNIEHYDGLTFEVTYTYNGAERVEYLEIDNLEYDGDIYRARTLYTEGNSQEIEEIEDDLIRDLNEEFGDIINDEATSMQLDHDDMVDDLRDVLK